MDLNSATPVALALLVVLALGCRDRGEEPYERAHADYQRLVAAGKLPQDAAFDELLLRLEKIPTDSRASPSAQRLAAAIRSSRGVKLPVPLAVDRAVPGESFTVTNKRIECVTLAKALGPAKGDGRDKLQNALARCEEQLRALAEQGHPHTP